MKTSVHTHYPALSTHWHTRYQKNSQGVLEMHAMMILKPFTLHVLRLFLDWCVCVCVCVCVWVVISVSLLVSDVLPGLDSLREDLEASQPDKVVYTLS